MSAPPASISRPPRPASEEIWQQANLPLDCFCPVCLVLSQLQHFVWLFITSQRRHHLQQSPGMRFNRYSLDFQSGDYALKLFLHGRPSALRISFRVRITARPLHAATSPLSSSRTLLASSSGRKGFSRKAQPCANVWCCSIVSSE